MSIERALIKFKGDVRAAADYILAGAPLKPPGYVLKGKLFYPLFEPPLEKGIYFEASGIGSPTIQDGDTYILEKDLENFNHQYSLHAGFEDPETARSVENLIYTFANGPTELSLTAPPLPIVLDTNTEEVDFQEFEPYDIKPGTGGEFTFLFEVFRRDKRRQRSKTVYMTLDTAQLYLERGATEENNRAGLLARLIAKEKEDDWEKYVGQWELLQEFIQKNYVTFGDYQEEAYEVLNQNAVEQAGNLDERFEVGESSAGVPSSSSDGSDSRTLGWLHRNVRGRVKGRASSSDGLEPLHPMRKWLHRNVQGQVTRPASSSDSRTQGWLHRNVQGKVTRVASSYDGLQPPP